MTGNDGCITEKSITAVIDNCTGVPVVKGATELSVSPNPSHGAFRIEVRTGSTATADLRIINILGKTVWSENGIALNGTLVRAMEPGLLTPGIYFVELAYEGQKLVRKVVVD